MKCPNCKRDALYVTDSRECKDPLGIRRRRTCAYCHHRITTYEITQEKWSQMQRAYKDSINKKFEREIHKKMGVKDNASSGM